MSPLVYDNFSASVLHDLESGETSATLPVEMSPKLDFCFLMIRLRLWFGGSVTRVTCPSHHTYQGARYTRHDWGCEPLSRGEGCFPLPHSLGASH